MRYIIVIGGFICSFCFHLFRWLYVRMLGSSFWGVVGEEFSFGKLTYCKNRFAAFRVSGLARQSREVVQAEKDSVRSGGYLFPINCNHHIGILATFNCRHALRT